MHEFRLPTPTLNRLFGTFAIAALIGLGIAHWLSGSGISIVTAVVIVIISVGSYFYTKQYVWVRLSADGIFGTGYTGRNLKISWNQRVTLGNTHISNMEGIEIRLTENDNLLKKKVSSVFIPTPISNTPEFLAVVHKFAPSDHPLKQMFAEIRK
jgi:hypothetical protein